MCWLFFYLLVCPVNLPGVQEASNTSFVGLCERVRDGYRYISFVEIMCN